MEDSIEMNNLFFKILLLWILLFGSNVQAGDLYKIELLIFSQYTATSEVFNQTSSQIAWPKKTTNLSAYKKVSSKYMNLKGSYSKLARAKGYKPLMHKAWVQKVNANSYGRAIKIRSPDGTINGFFRLQRGHLVHMVVDMEYSRGRTIYRLNEKRRFKLNETHYLDHPKFGILARISPL